MKSKSKRCHAAPFLVLMAPGDQPLARLGMIIPKRLARHARLRNRIRRLLREGFRVRRAGMPALDIVVMLRGAAGDMSDGQLCASVETLWQRLEGSFAKHAG